MRLRDIHPEDFLRAGSLLGSVSDQVGDTIAESRCCAEVRWVGRPNQLYQRRLRDLSNDLCRVRSSFDDAGNALILYAHALGVVRDLALQADLLEAQAHDLVQFRQQHAWHDHQDGTPTSSLAMTPREQALLDRALLLRREAEEISNAASRRLTALLRELADHAMRVEGWQSFNRGIARAGESFSGVVTANVVLEGDAFQSLPGIGDENSRTEARKELWAAGAAMLQPWLAVEQMVSQLKQGEYARTVGEAAGVFILKGHGGRKVELFGAHDAMSLEVLSSLKGVGKLDRAMLVQAQKAFWAELMKYSKLPAPTVEELLANGVNLVQQEALGGHTLLKHLGRDFDFLKRRQDVEFQGEGTPGPMSTFVSEEEAELVINRTIAIPENAAILRAWAASGVSTTLRLRGSVAGVGMVSSSVGSLVRSTLAIVEFKKDTNGHVFLNTSFLDHG